MGLRPFIIFAFPFFLFSCATILNSPVQRIEISGDQRIQRIKVDSSINDFRHGDFYYVRRSKHKLKVSFFLDSSQKTIYIKAHSSPAFWWNIYFNYGLGMLIDRKKPERYQYRKHLFIAAKDSGFRILSFVPDRKGDLRLHLALPYFNSLSTRRDKGNFTGTTFFGFESGLDYFYKTARYFSVYAGAGSGCPIPVPAPLDLRGEFQTASCVYTSVRNNYVFNRFELGYGLQYSELTWIKKNYSDSIFAPLKVTSKGIGLSLHTSYRMSSKWTVNVLYQPNFVQLSSKPVLEYTHFFTIGFLRKINFRTAVEKLKYYLK